MESLINQLNNIPVKLVLHILSFLSRNYYLIVFSLGENNIHSLILKYNIHLNTEYLFDEELLIWNLLPESNKKGIIKKS